MRGRAERLVERVIGEAFRGPAWIPYRPLQSLLEDGRIHKTPDRLFGAAGDALRAHARRGNLDVGHVEQSVGGAAGIRRSVFEVRLYL